MRKVIVHLLRWVLTAGIILAANGCDQGAQQSRPQSQKADVKSAAPAEIIRVGVLLPLSGDAATWGVSMKEGIELAFEQLARERPPTAASIGLATEDDRGAAATGVSATQKLLAADKIRGMVGIANSSVALAILPVLDAAKIVLVSGGASSPKLSGASPFFFRTWPSDVFEAIMMARYARDHLKIERLSILYINNEYGTGLREPFNKEFTRLKGKILAEEAFPQDSTDFRTQLLRAVRSKPQAIYLVGNPREIARCIKQARELSIKLPVLGTSAVRDPEVLKIAGEAATGVLFTDASFDSASENAETQRFIKAFKQKYNKEPGMLAVTGYDALRVLVQAFDAVGTDGEAVAKYLRGLKEFAGAAGTIRFDENGDVHRPVRISTITGGAFVTKERIE